MDSFGPMLDLPCSSGERRHTAQNAGLHDVRPLEALHEPVRLSAIQGEGIQHRRSIARWVKVTEEIGEPTFAGERHDAGPLALAHAADIAEHFQIDATPYCFRLDRITEIGPRATCMGVSRPALGLAAEADG